MLVSCRGLYSNHGGLAHLIEADFDGHFFICHARLQDKDLIGALFDVVLDAVLIAVSEDTLHLFITSFDLVIGHTSNPKFEYLRLGIS